MAGSWNRPETLRRRYVFWCYVASDVVYRSDAKAGTNRLQKLRENWNQSRRPKLLGGGLGLGLVEGQSEARLVAIRGVLVEHALGDGLIDGGHRGVQESGSGGGVAGGNGGAQTLHGGTHAGAVRLIDGGAFARLDGALENGLFLLLYFGTLTLGHVLVLLLQYFR